MPPAFPEPWQYRDDGHRAVTYTPSGQETVFASRRAAYAWVTSGRALTDLRRDAQQVIDTGGRSFGFVMRLVDGRLQRVNEDPDECAARVEQARRWLEIHDQIATAA
jgi:hypothetical protein